MSKKQYFVLIDTETTVDNTVADFAACIVDRKGNIHAQCAILVKGEFDAKELFFDPCAKAGDLWTRDYAKQKRERYNAMLDSGVRMMATANAINRWLDKAQAKYNPCFWTAYNAAFDSEKCTNTNIDLSMFKNRVCLWQAAMGNICTTKRYREFVLANHRFNNVTKQGNQSFRTDCETVAGFVNGSITKEPHDALGDLLGFEIPILAYLLNRKNWQDKVIAHNWRNVQVKDHFKAI